MDANSQRSAVLILFLFFLSFCNQKNNTVHRGYYYWRSGEMTIAERKFLKAKAIDRLYARLMDVDWNEVHGPVPVSAARLESLNHTLSTYDSLSIEMVPVVFITNKTFEKIDTNDIPILAKRLVRRCLPAYDKTDVDYEERFYFRSYGGAIRPKEIQFDCDWTKSTEKKYFRFLQLVKQLLPSDSIKLSATIRLHQYAHPKQTGIPPVDRGMLMVYNVSDPKKYLPVNSIFEMDRAKSYFTTTQYPLPLDIALPAWSWCIIYRNKTFYQIENGIGESDLESASFLSPGKYGFYKVTTDTVYRDLFLRRGDEIKAEGVDEETLIEIAALSKKALNTEEYSVSLFELSEKEIKNYSDESIDKIFHLFR